MAADPGMEDARSYDIRDAMLERCTASGIYNEVVSGGDLFKDMIEACRNGSTRVDNPPLWVLNEDGSVAQIMQKCTRYYKIAPMRAAIRRYAETEGIGISKPGSVEQWIGFAYDERRRVKPSDVKFIQLRYPLIDLRLTRAKVSGLYAKWAITEPPMSVCNACFANGLNKFRWMHKHDQAGWRQAVEFDNALRGKHGVPGVNGKCFVSKTCIPLEELAAMNFELPKEYGKTQVDYSCDSGFCFV